ncbi:MAG: pyridoxal-dependent decarboxylase [Gemmatimonadota bacterium]|nr:pyridoxal-dependent decarboxylase [Gemmatimonadota bacterium]
MGVMEPGDGRPARHSASPGPGGMPPGEFREWGHQLVDWVAGYLENLERYPVLAEVEPGWVRGGLAAEAPVRGEPMESLLEDFRSVVLPGITHWNHPAFFAYFAVSGSGPGILGELLAAALNVNAMVWKASPAATELEQVTLDWLRGFLGLPPGFTGTINDTASISTFHALAAARERRLPEARVPGLSGARPGRVYATPETHSSILKAVRALGLGRDGLRVVATGPERGMDPAALARTIDQDVASGFRPLAVVATIGTTSVTAVDPVGEIADVAAAHELWLHVDAAYAGPAAALPRMRRHFRGWERADSIVINPHKWLFTPIDCSVLYVRDPGALHAAFSLTPAYLETGEEGVRHNMDLGLALGHRFRALKLWMVMRYFGQEGLRAILDHHLGLARLLAGMVDAAPGWERWRPAPFSLVVLRHSPPGVAVSQRDAANLEIMHRVNAGGTAFLSHTEIDGEVWLRVAIGNIHTMERHVHSTWAALLEAAEPDATATSN